MLLQRYLILAFGGANEMVTIMFSEEMICKQGFGAKPHFTAFKVASKPGIRPVKCNISVTSNIDTMITYMSSSNVMRLTVSITRSWLSALSFE